STPSRGLWSWVPAFAGMTIRPRIMVLKAIFTLVTVALALAAPASAQEWPTRPVTMVVPFPPGGGVDTGGRIMASKLSELLGQQVIIENVPGAGGMLGAARVA